MYLFKDMKWQNRVINRISFHIFGIFILNVPVMKYIHVHVLRIDEVKVNSDLFPIWMLVEVALTFACCLVLDMLREVFLGRFFTGMADRIVRLAKKWRTAGTIEITQKVEDLLKRKED